MDKVIHEFNIYQNHKLAFHKAHQRSTESLGIIRTDGISVMQTSWLEIMMDKIVIFVETKTQPTNIQMQ